MIGGGSSCLKVRFWNFKLKRRVEKVILMWGLKQQNTKMDNENY